MNKNLIWKIGLIFLTAGVSLFLIGSLNGGKKSAVINSSGKIEFRDIRWNLGLINFDSGFNKHPFSIKFNPNSSITESPNIKLVDRNYNFDETIKKMKLDVNEIARIEIKEVVGNEVKIETNDPNIDVSLNDETLTITKESITNGYNTSLFNYSDDLFNRYKNDTKLIIYLPKDSDYQNIEIKSAFTNLKLTDLNTLNLDASNRFGTFEMSNVMADTGDISNKFGTMVISDSKFNDLTAENKTGTTDVNNLTANNAKIISSLGEASLNNLNVEILSIEASLGDLTVRQINSDYIDVSSKNGSASLKEVTVHEKVYISSSLGSFDLWLNDNYEDYNFEIDSSFGDVEINNKQYSGQSEIFQNASRFVNIDSSNSSVTIKTK